MSAAPEVTVSHDGILWTSAVGRGAQDVYPLVRYRWLDALWPWTYPPVAEVTIRRFSRPARSMSRRELTSRLVLDGTRGQPGPDEEPTGS